MAKGWNASQSRLFLTGRPVAYAQRYGNEAAARLFGELTTPVSARNADFGTSFRGFVPASSRPKQVVCFGR